MSRPNVDLALTVVLALITKAGEVSAEIAQARAENRDLSGEQLTALGVTDDMQRDLLVDAIARAKAALQD